MPGLLSKFASLLIPAVAASSPAAPPDPVADALGLARAHMQSQMPRESAGLESISPMGAFMRWMGPDDLLSTRGGSVTYNQPALADLFSHFRARGYTPAEQQARLDDYLAHELTHVGQNMRQPWYEAIRQNLTLPYDQRPNEIEAYRTMDERQAMRRDLPLGTAYLEQRNRTHKP